MYISMELDWNIRWTGQKDVLCERELQCKNKNLKATKI